MIRSSHIVEQAIKRYAINEGIKVEGMSIIDTLQIGLRILDLMLNDDKNYFIFRNKFKFNTNDEVEYFSIESGEVLGHGVIIGRMERSGQDNLYLLGLRGDGRIVYLTGELFLDWKSEHNLRFKDPSLRETPPIEFF